MAVQNLNARSQKEGSQIRASFSKSRPQNTRTCHIRVKYLPKNISQEDVCAEFARFGNITRCKLVQYEQNCTAHLSFDTVESADLARQSMNGQCWSDHSDRLMIEFNSAYPSNGRKSNSHPGDEFADSSYNQQQQQMVDDQPPAAFFSQQQQPNHPQMTSFYNFMQPQQPQVDEYQPAKPPAQYVQLNSYCWPPQQSGLVYDGQAQNGQNGLANSPPVKQQPATAQEQPQWAQFYSQLVQQMQNTHLYPPAAAGGAQYAHAAQGQYAMQAAPQQAPGSQPLLLNPQSVYCATALSPSPQNYSLFINPQAAAQGGYFRGAQLGPAQMAQTNFGRFAGAQAQFRPVMGGYQKGGGGGGQLGGGRQNANNTLYVYNTGNSMTEEGLRSLFSRFGTILDVSVPRDPSTGASRNFGFVNYLEGSAARVAIEQMNGFMFYDRVLQVSYKRPRVSTNTNQQQQQQQNNVTGGAGAQQRGNSAGAAKEKRQEEAAQVCSSREDQQEPLANAAAAAGTDADGVEQADPAVAAATAAAAVAANDNE